VRDDAGEPTGILVDNAADLVKAKIPELSFDERVERLKRAVAACRRYGVTGVHDAGVGAKDLEAVRGFTRNAAFASFMEHITGTIQPSMLADITILDIDPFVIPAREILSTRVVYTVVGGRVVYEAPGKASAEE